MRTSESILKITPALVKAIAKIKTIKKDSKNPFFKNNYASLDAIIDGTKETLSQAGICVMQTVSDCGVETILLHESGEWIGSDCLHIDKEVGKGMSLAQSVGVTVTYAKRYQLAAMLNISTGEDVDGQFPEGTTPPEQPKKPSEPKPLPAIDSARLDKACQLISKGNKDALTGLRKSFTLTNEQSERVQEAIDLFEFNANKPKQDELL